MSMLKFKLEAKSYSNPVCYLYADSGNKITDYDKISHGDRIRLALNFDNIYEEEWKPCLLLLAVFGENGKLKDYVIEEGVLNPFICNVFLSTDYITINNPTGEKLSYEGYLWESYVLPKHIEELILENKQMQEVGVYKPDFSGFTEYVEEKIVEPSGYFCTYEDVKKQYFDTVSFVLDSSHIYSAGKKYIIEEKPVWKDGKFWVPESVMMKIFGRSFSDKEIFDGTAYVWLQSAASEMSLYSSETPSGLGVISPKPIDVAIHAKLDDVKKMIRYIVFDRPSRETLKKSMLNVSNPRAIASMKIFEAIKNSKDKNVVLMSESILAEADMRLAEETPIPTPCGDHPEGAEFNTVLKLYWMYYLTGDRRYADKAIEHAMRMADWENWMGHYYFLGTAFYMLTCGYVYDLFQNELTEEQKNKLKKAIFDKGLIPARQHYYGEGPSNWPLRDNNWNVVCNAGTIVAALAICNDYETDICFDIIEKALVSMEYALMSFAPDGGWYECVGYSVYTTNYLSLTLQALNTAFGKSFSIVEVPGFLKYGYFPYYASGNEGVLFFYDEELTDKFPKAISTQWIANNTKDRTLQAMRLNQIKTGNGGKASFFDMLWYTPLNSTLHMDVPLDINYSLAGIASSRSSWEGDGTFLGIHANDNASGHGHSDIGHFELEVKGTRFAYDMGRDDYGLLQYNYNGSHREDFYAARAEGHNVYVINPSRKKDQYHYAVGSIEQIESKPDGAIYTVDMLTAYIEQVKAAKRGFMLTHNRQVFVMQDEITPQKAGDEYYWFWHTDADIVIDEKDNSHVTLIKNGIKLNLYFDANVDFTVKSGLSVPLPTSHICEGQLKTYGMMKKLTARFKAGTEEIKFRVTAVPEGEDYIVPSRIDSISEWKIADGIRSDRYTIADGTILNVPTGIETVDFLSHIYTGRQAKRLMLNGEEYTGEIVPEGATLEVGEDGKRTEYTLKFKDVEYATLYDGKISTFDGEIYAKNADANKLGEGMTAFFLSEANGKENYIKSVPCPELGGNALNITATSKSIVPTNMKVYAFLSEDEYIDAQEIKISFDFKAEKKDGIFEFFGIFNELTKSILKFNADGTITSFDNIITRYNTEDWNHIEVYMAPGVSNLYRLYMDGEIIYKGSPAWLSGGSPIKCFAFSALAGKGKDISYFINNFKVEEVIK